MRIGRRKSPGTSSLKGTHKAGWSQERIDKLKELWSQGISCSLIASQLGGVTRNGVIGKVHRLGLSGRKTIDKEPRQPRKRVLRPRGAHRDNPWHFVALRQPATPPPAPPASDVPRVTFAGLEPHHCRWPISDADDQSVVGFCGCDHVPGLPYCAHHAERAYAPPKVESSRVAKAIPHLRAGKVTAEDREEVLA